VAGSGARRRIRTASFVVAVGAAIFGAVIAATIFALSSTCGLFETPTAGAGKHVGGLFAVVALILGLAELIVLGVAVWRRRARLRYVVALPLAVSAAYAVTLIAMWGVLRLIWGPTRCQSTGLF
jgi:cytochrome c-type biogenesis protein CcmE